MEKQNVNFRERSGNFLQEFKKFALKDSTLTIAIGLMLATAVKSVIDSLVQDVLTPPIAKLISGIDFSNLYISLSSQKYESLQAAQEAGAVVITYGNFINALISFIITALVLFLIVSAAQKFSKKEEKKEERKMKTCPYCKSEIHKDAKKCAFCTSSVK